MKCLVYLLPVLLIFSCHKTIPATPIRTFSGPNPATQGALLVKQVYLFPDSESWVTTYQYDSERRLIAMLKSGPLGYNTYYDRDAHGRITRRIVTQNGIGDTLDVFYADPVMGIISYTIERSGTVFRDSAAYTYNKGHYPASIAIYALTVLPAQLGSVDSIAYDAGGNVSQFRTFMPGAGGQLSLSLGYDFQYDDDINPLYSPDDCRIADEGAAIISPNNQLKQTNHYGDPPVMPVNYVTMTYQYRSDKKPSYAATGGTAADPGSVPQITFYYQ